ncbi:HAD-IA family hydrolase [Veronia pacifica]|uniref:Phosphatase n=1 Tax=Veronia pacifica TaxID=1080227 RepID=A0A1C3ESF6_9GAMM|nr:HAD-IA family hydrolase [Veronia pacifica]ODA36148.1 phosphatase [Veronia pacifica]
MENFDFDTAISCIIFDCEGTLVDSEILSQQALVNTFAHFGETLSLDECVEHFQGGKITDVLLQTCERKNVSFPIDKLELRYRKECDKLFSKHLKPMEGVTELLDHLYQIGLDVCVASNGPIDRMYASLEVTDLLPYFEGRLFSAYETNNWKPAPDVLRYAAMNMATPKEHCLFIDDTLSGIKAGINAGMRTLHFNNTGRKTISHPLIKTVTSMKKVAKAINRMPVASNWH